MKKKMLAIFLVAVMTVGLTACGGGSETSSKNEEKVYVSEDDYADVFNNANDYKGQYITLTGRIFNQPTSGSDGYCYQVWYDIKNSDKDFLFETEDNSYAVDDYVKVEGKITGAAEGTNAFGGELSYPNIETTSVEKISYIDAVAPTTKEIAPAVSAEQNGVTATVDKVEYSDVETRLYMTIANNSDATVSYGVYSIRLIVDGQQMDQDQSSSSAYEGQYAELSYDVSPGATTTGVLVFPVLDPAKSFQVIVPDVYSDNYEVEFSDFTLDIAAQ